MLVSASAHKHRRYGNFEIELDTGNETIKPVDCEILLGASLSNNFQWNQHVRDGKKAILSSLNKKNTALVKIAQITDFKTRKNIGTSLIMPTLSYITEVYGSCSEYLLDALQVQQNKAAKIITKLPFRTPTQTFLLQCDWLSVRQLVKYCSLTLLHKIMIEKKPQYIFDRLVPRSMMGMRETRRTDHLCLQMKNYKTVTASRTFIPRSVALWNSLPSRLREITDIKSFKIQLKTFIKAHVPVK